MSNEEHERGVEAACRSYIDVFQDTAPNPDAPRRFGDMISTVIKAYLDASGLVPVPREPTTEMVRSAYEARDPGFCDEPGDVQSPQETWAEMISAATNPFE